MGKQIHVLHLHSVWPCVVISSGLHICHGHGPCTMGTALLSIPSTAADEPEAKPSHASLCGCMALMHQPGHTAGLGMCGSHLVTSLLEAEFGFFVFQASMDWDFNMWPSQVAVSQRHVRQWREMVAPRPKNCCMVDEMQPRPRDMPLTFGKPALLQN